LSVSSTIVIPRLLKILSRLYRFAEISYKATLLLEDTAKIAPEAGRKVLLVTNAGGMRLVSGATVKYYLGDKQHPVMVGTVKTDAAGQYLFTSRKGHYFRQ